MLLSSCLCLCEREGDHATFAGVSRYEIELQAQGRNHLTNIPVLPSTEGKTFISWGGHRVWLGAGRIVNHPRKWLHLLPKPRNNENEAFLSHWLSWLFIAFYAAATATGILGKDGACLFSLWSCLHGCSHSFPSFLTHLMPRWYWSLRYSEEGVERTDVGGQETKQLLLRRKHIG